MDQGQLRVKQSVANGEKHCIRILAKHELPLCNVRRDKPRTHSLVNEPAAPISWRAWEKAKVGRNDDAEVQEERRSHWEKHGA